MLRLVDLKFCMLYVKIALSLPDFPKGYIQLGNVLQSISIRPIFTGLGTTPQSGLHSHVHSTVDDFCPKDVYRLTRMNLLKNVRRSEMV